MPSLSAASDPNTTVGRVAVASLRKMPSARVAPRVSRRLASVAITAMPPVCSLGMRSERRTVAPAT